MGCYDVSAGKQNKIHYLKRPVSARMCAHVCRGSVAFGMKATDSCMCFGDTFRQMPLVADGKCTVKCELNPNDNCGGNENAWIHRK